MRPNAWSRTAPAALMAVLLTVLLGGCGADGGNSERVAPEDGVPPAQGQPFPQENGEDVDGEEGRLVIRAKTLRLEVEETPEAIAEIRELARGHEGSVTDMQVATASDEWIYHYDEEGYPMGDGAPLRGWVTVRVPTDSFEEFIDEVVDIGKVLYQAESSNDVTQKHVDLSARLQNLRAQEARLREFFEAAKDVTEMLAIEKELGRVRGEIESLDAQVKLLERQAAMATVTLELTEPDALVRPEGDSWGFVAAITSGIQGAAALLTGTLTVLIATAPLWLAALVLYFPIRAMLRRRRARQTRPDLGHVPTVPPPASPPTPEAPAKSDEG